jgi:hypothetical protein
MDEIENLDARLRTLLDKRGQEFVKAVVEEFTSLSREIAALRRELSALTAYQASRDRWLAIETEQAKIAKLPRVVVIEPDQVLPFQDGFYPVEHTSDGTPFRWTGPSPHFSFDVFIDRSLEVEVRLDVLNCIDFDVQKNLSLLADGESVPVTLKEAAPGFTATAILPRREGKEGTNLVFVLPATIAPPGTEDTRSLGVAFAKFRAVAGVAESSGAGEHVTAAIGADELGLSAAQV